MPNNYRPDLDTRERASSNSRWKRELMRCTSRNGTRNIQPRCVSSAKRWLVVNAQRAKRPGNHAPYAGYATAIEDRRPALP